MRGVASSRIHTFVATLRRYENGGPPVAERNVLLTEHLE